MRQQVKNSNNYLIKQLPTATAYVNLDFKITHISDSWVNAFCYSRNFSTNNDILEMFPILNQKWKQDIEYAFLGFKNEAKTDKYLNHYDNSNWLEWIISPWYNEKENIIGAIIQIEDVTEKTMTKLRLEKLEVLLKTKSEISKIGSWEYNAITDDLTWCDRTKQIHEVDVDYKPNIATAINFYKEGECRKLITECVEKGMHDGISWNKKFQLTTAKGNPIWVLAAGKPLFEDNKFTGIIGSFQDITKDVLNQKKTKENELLLRTLIDNLPLNVFIKDLNSRKILVNKAECEFLGVSNDEIIGKDDFDFYDVDVAQYSRNEDLQIINTLKPVIGREILNVKKDGTKTSFLTSKIPFLNEQNEPIGIIGFSFDITNLKQKEEELRRLVNISSLQNKKLINFAHIISHNLRSHTANFSMLLGFLIKEKDDLERENLLQMLITASDNLLETIDNLNEVVEINTNHNLHKAPIHVNTKINSIEKSLKSLLKNKNSKIVNLIPDTTYIKGIPNYVDNILLNILSNAIKFKDPDKQGEIILSTTKIKNYTILSIKDNGFGIDLEKNKSKIFGMYKTFHQHKDSRGIGLYISKNQIEAMNGKFVIESMVGIGTTFNIYFNEND